MKRLISTAALIIACIQPAISSELAATMKTSLLRGDYSASEVYEEKTNFDCSDKILLLAEISGATPGEALETEVQWINPSGDAQERVSINVGVNSSGDGQLFSFIQFRKGPGAAMFSMFDPAMSLEQFIGGWEVRIMNSGNTVGSYEFEVVC